MISPSGSCSSGVEAAEDGALLSGALLSGTEEELPPVLPQAVRDAASTPASSSARSFVCFMVYSFPRVTGQYIL